MHSCYAGRQIDRRATKVSMLRCARAHHMKGASKNEKSPSPFQMPPPPSHHMSEITSPPGFTASVSPDSRPVSNNKTPKTRAQCMSGGFTGVLFLPLTYEYCPPKIQPW